jgi:hypothetical protein
MNQFSLPTPMNFVTTLRKRSVAFLIGCIAFLIGQNSVAEEFRFLVEKDAGFCLELDWKGRSGMSECQISTGERGDPMPINLRLDPSDKDAKSALSAIFVDADKASVQAECVLAVLVVICRNTKELAVKARSIQGSASDAFVSTTGFVMCIDGLSGPGACRDVVPVTNTKSKK